MNTNSIIHDYGKTVDPLVYMRALQGHPYIPQSDECGIRIITKYVGSNILATILDLGCGPGRLTFEIAKRTCANVIGVDISESFISYAVEQKNKRALWGEPEFYLRDFAKDSTYRFGQQMDVIFMQGVMHHIHGADRKSFLTRCHDLLKKDGIFVISDEFIRDYDTDYGRMLNVCKFYLHIIDEARKGGFNELAEEEARNFIDDWFSGTEFAGFTSSEIFEVIYEYAKSINTIFYEFGSGSHGLRNHTNSDRAYNQIENLIKAIKKSVHDLVGRDDVVNLNRGDYKVSMQKFTAELADYDFVPHQVYKIGPVDQLGGMGVIVFKKL